MNAMKLAALALAVAVAAPAWADKKLDDAVAKAEDQLAKGRQDEAVKTLQKAVNGAQSDPLAHLALARLLQKLGRLDEAGQSIATAAQLGASAAPGVKAQALAAQAEFELATGAGRAALGHAQEAVQAEATGRTLSILATAQARLGDGAAVQTADKAVAAAPNNADALAARGWAQAGIRQWPQAEAAFREALKADPRHVRALVGLATTLTEQGRPAEAEAEARKATEIDQQAAEAFAALGLALLKKDPAKNWGEAINQAQQGNFLNPKSVVTQLIVGQIFEAAGRYNEAISAYDKALEVDTGFTAARLAKVKVQMRQNPKTAVAEACKVAAELAASADMQMLCANSLLLSGEYQKAIPYLEKAAQLSPSMSEAHLRLASALFLTNQADKAIPACKKAAELDPGNVETLTACGLITAKGGDAAGGVKMLGEATRRDPKNVNAWMNLGWANRSMEPPKVDDSVAAYKKALELDPKNTQAALGMAWAHVYAEHWPEAEAAFTKVAELDPNMVGEANYGIARTWYFRTDMAKAREFAQKAATAGRDVSALNQAIEKYEKASADADARRKLLAEQRRQQQQAADSGGSLADSLQRLNYGKPDAKRAACREVAAFGAPGAPQLARVLQVERDVSVREACVDALGSLGSKAREAIPVLEYLINDPPAVNPNANKDELAAEMRELDLIKRMKAALAKIKG